MHASPLVQIMNQCDLQPVLRHECALEYATIRSCAQQSRAPVRMRRTVARLNDIRECFMLGAQVLHVSTSGNSNLLVLETSSVAGCVHALRPPHLEQVVRRANNRHDMSHHHHHHVNDSVGSVADSSIGDQPQSMRHSSGQAVSPHNRRNSSSNSNSNSNSSRHSDVNSDGNSNNSGVRLLFLHEHYSHVSESRIAKAFVRAGVPHVLTATGAGNLSLKDTDLFVSTFYSLLFDGRAVDDACRLALQQLRAEWCVVVVLLLCCCCVIVLL